MKKKRIVILADGFMNWPGGVDFFTTNVLALLAIYNPENMHITLLFPEKKFFKKKYRPFLKVSIIKKILGRRVIQKSSWLTAFKKQKKEVEFAFSPYGRKKLNRSLKHHRADFALLCWSDIHVKPFDIGYYPDLQHKHFPEFFSPEECKKRDQTIHNILLHRKCLLVNAQAVKKDIKKFFPKTPCKIVALPFAPILLDKEWLESLRYDVKIKYGIFNPYFMISNQFWVHKSHRTAFDAIRKLMDTTEGKNIHLVCTGRGDDYRFPGYYQELLEHIDQLGIQEHVHLLSHIPKREQIELMKQSLGVLQPTLCEGGPGGGSVYNAISLGTQVIASNIPVNREIAEKEVFFFKAKDSDDLLSKMLHLLKKGAIQISREDLLQKREENIAKLGNILLKVLEN